MFIATLILLALALAACAWLVYQNAKYYDKYRALVQRVDFDREKARDTGDIAMRLKAKVDELEDNVEQSHLQLLKLTEERAKLAKARNVAWARPPKRLAPHEVKRAFAIAETSPIWTALNQELDDYLQDVLDQVSLPPSATLSEEARLHLAGGIEHIRLLQKRLLEVHASAQKQDTDLEAAPGV